VSLFKKPHWKLESNSNGVSVFKNKTPTNADFAAFLGVVEMDAPPMAVVSYLTESEHKAEYDEIFDNSEVLHAFDEATHIER